jgi:uncharacterized membrane protein YadS
VLNSLLPIPKAITEAGNTLSRWCLVTSIAAIGVKTHLGDIVKVGLRPVLLMFFETALLAAMVLALLKWGGV